MPKNDTTSYYLMGVLSTHKPPIKYNMESLRTDAKISHMTAKTNLLCK